MGRCKVQLTHKKKVGLRFNSWQKRENKWKFKTLKLNWAMLKIIPPNCFARNPFFFFFQIVGNGLWQKLVEVFRQWVLAWWWKSKGICNVLWVLGYCWSQSKKSKDLSPLEASAPVTWQVHYSNQREGNGTLRFQQFIIQKSCAMQN